MVIEFEEAGETRIHDQDQSDFHAYLLQLENSSQGIGLKPVFVPATTFWLLKKNDRILGDTNFV